MAKAEAPTFWSTFFSGQVTTRTHGRLVRQLTGLALTVILLVGAWTLRENLGEPRLVREGVPVLVVGLGLWLTFRILNYPPFVDFLAAVETEMAKVNWPSLDYLWRATGVVLGVMLILAAALKLFDFIWLVVFRWIGFLQF